MGHREAESGGWELGGWKLTYLNKASEVQETKYYRKVLAS